MNVQQALFAPAAGIAVVVSSVAAFGAAFGILVGIGLAAVAVVTGGLALSGKDPAESAGA